MSFTIPLRRTTTAGISTTTTSTLLLSSRTIPTTTTTSSSATTITATGKTTFICSQCRHATLLRRPKRPYTFTQLVTLSDGSTFTHRTSSPVPVYRSTRDTRNSLLWNPSSSKLMNVEEDEAGRLAAFRARFGRGFDAASAATATASVGAGAASGGGGGGDAGEVKQSEEEENKAKAKAEAGSQAQAQVQAQAALEEAEDDAYDDNLLDLISSFGQDDESQGQQRESTGKKKK